MPENITLSILVIDDDPNIRQSIETYLVDRGHRVVLAASGEEGLGLLHKEYRPAFCSWSLSKLRIFSPDVKAVGLVTKKALLQTPKKPDRATLSKPITAPSSSTKLATCHSICKPGVMIEASDGALWYAGGPNGIGRFDGENWAYYAHVF